MPDRRRLQFDRLDAIMPEVDRLLRGHAAAGRWTLGQVCKHLADTMRASVEGMPFLAPWPVRRLVGPIAKRRVLRTGRIPEGIRLPGPYQPRPDLDDRAEAEALRATLHHYGFHTGPYAEHPFFGKLTGAEWARIHAIHAAHHLGFLVPEPAPAAPGEHT